MRTKLRYSNKIIENKKALLNTERKEHDEKY